MCFTCESLKLVIIDYSTAPHLMVSRSTGVWAVTACAGVREVDVWAVTVCAGVREVGGEHCKL